MSQRFAKTKITKNMFSKQINASIRKETFVPSFLSNSKRRSSALFTGNFFLGFHNHIFSVLSFQLGQSYPVH